MSVSIPSLGPVNGSGAVNATVLPDLKRGLRLSATEASVLALCASGFSDREISVQLGRTENQVKYAIRNAMFRLGAVSRPHAVAIGIYLGHISFPSSIRDDGGRE